MLACIVFGFSYLCVHVLSDLPTQMQKIVTVTFVADKLWSPAVLILDDKQFVNLNKWDPQLTHFIRGRHQRLRDGKSEKVHINVAFWGVLHEARRTAMNTALANSTRVAQTETIVQT